MACCLIASALVLRSLVRRGSYVWSATLWWRLFDVTFLERVAGSAELVSAVLLALGSLVLSRRLLFLGGASVRRSLGPPRAGRPGRCPAGGPGSRGCAT